MTHPDQFDVDVVVVGAGGGGLSAALAASEAGASVVVLEKLGAPGGNTALSTGSIPAAGSRLQREAGVDDNPERMFADLMLQSGHHEAEGLTRRLAETSGSLVDWLVDVHKVKLALITDYKHVGHSVNRLHAPVSRRGADLVADLVLACRRQKIDIATNNPVVELLIENGGVCGATVGGDRVGRYTVRSRSVILASNGFAANRRLLAQWAPDIATVEYFGAYGSTGEGIEWGLALDGHLLNQGAYQGYAAVAYPHGSILSWTTVEKGGLLVDSTGSRLGDESVGYSGFTQQVLSGQAPCYVVFDQRIMGISRREPEFDELVQSGGVRLFDTADELAAGIKVPSVQLAATLDAFAAAAEGRVPDPFGRINFGLSPLLPPYAASRVTPGLFHTQGGLAVDGDGRVLKHSGDPVPGLFAVGGVAVGISGRAGGRGYSSGNGLLTALGLGRLAGTAAGTRL